MRELKGLSAKISFFFTLSWCGIIVYTAGRGSFHPTIQGLVAFALPALSLTFMLYPRRKKEPSRSTPSFLDVVLIILSFLVCLYSLFCYKRWMITTASETSWDLILSAILLVLIVEAARRSLGKVIFILALVFIVYTLLGHYIPGKWGHRPIGYEWMLGNLYTTTAGYVGLVTWIVSSEVCIFILAGSVLFTCGAGETFIDTAKLIAGRIRGGAAQLAVVSSGFFGMISGSPVANVATTGAFTIPLMKRLGYSPVFAGAVETVASTGGQIMPPVMGAGAFIMAEMLGIKYIDVCVAAALPAILYFGGVGAGVYFHASKRNFPMVPKDEIPKLREVLTWPKLGPLNAFIVILLYFLIQGRTPSRSCFWGLVALMGLYLFTTGKMTLEGFKHRLTKIIDGLIGGGRNLISLGCIILCVQVIVYLIGLTGVGIKLSEVVFSVGGNSVLISLFLTGVIAMILGMGVPTTAAYVIGVSVMGLGLLKLGFAPLNAHLFIFYWSILSVITPPVCLAAYVAAGISGAHWLPTGWMAMRLGIAAYIVPFMFAFNPQLLLKGEFFEIMQVVITSIIGVCCLAAGMEGYLLTDANILQRIILLISALSLIDPGVMTDIVGIGGAFLVVVWQIFLARRVKIANVGI
jgi:TRAP transporter 4TM/12TM fusion protein